MTSKPVDTLNILDANTPKQSDILQGFSQVQEINIKKTQITKPMLPDFSKRNQRNQATTYEFTRDEENTAYNYDQSKDTI